MDGENIGIYYYIQIVKHDISLSWSLVVSRLLLVIPRSRLGNRCHYRHGCLRVPNFTDASCISFGICHYMAHTGCSSYDVAFNGNNLPTRLRNESAESSTKVGYSKLLHFLSRLEIMKAGHNFKESRRRTPHSKYRLEKLLPTA